MEGDKKMGLEKLLEIFKKEFGEESQGVKDIKKAIEEKTIVKN